MHKATTSFWLRNPDQEFAKQLKYVSNLSDKLATLEKTGNRLQEERNGIVNKFSRDINFVDFVVTATINMKINIHKNYVPQKFVNYFVASARVSCIILYAIILQHLWQLIGISHQ